MPKAPAINRVNVLEQAREVASQAWKKAGEGANIVSNDVSSQLSWGSYLGLKPPPDETVLKQQEDQSLMEDLDGFKQKLRELNEIQGKPTDEHALDEKVQKEIDEKRKRLFESLHRMRQEHKATADDLSRSPQTTQQQTQVEEQENITEEQEKESGKADKQARLENVVETPAGRETGLNPKLKRMRNPWRGTPRSTAKLRSASKLRAAETRAGRGVGG